MSKFSDVARVVLAKDKDLRVVPIQPMGKDHATKNAKDNALNTYEMKAFKDVILKVYRPNIETENFNVGVVPTNGINIIDVDCVEALERLRKECAEWTEKTFTVKTPRGFHFYWRTEKPFAKTYAEGKSGLGAGVETRNDSKNYVVAWGCEVSPDAYKGKPVPDYLHYDLYSNQPINTMPQALWDEIEAEEKSTKKDSGDFEEGGRNNGLFKYACGLIRSGAGPDAIRDRMSKVNQERGRPPVSERELNQIVKSAMRSEEKKPGENRGESFITPGITDQDTLKNCLDSLSVHVRYNLRNETVEVLWADENKEIRWRPMKDRARYRLAFEVERKCLVEKLVKRKTGDPVIQVKNVKLPADGFRRALYAISDKYEVDSFVLWLESLPQWDGTPRLDGLLTHFFNSDSPEAFTPLGDMGNDRGAIGRAYEPGRKQDEMPVMIGAQGIGKSTFWEKLLPNPDWYTDNLNLSENSQKRVESMLGNVIAECAELQGMHRTELNNLKAFMSRGTDKVRLAYRENSEGIPRRVVFVGTTNEAGCLPKDSTGNRRFVPIRVTGEAGALPTRIRAELPKIRGQVWAEGLERYRQGITSFLPVDNLGLLQDETREHEAVNEVTDQAIVEALLALSKRNLLFGEGERLFKLKMLTDEMIEPTPKMARLREIGHSLRVLGCEKVKHRKFNACWELPVNFVEEHRHSVDPQLEPAF